MRCDLCGYEGTEPEAFLLSGDYCQECVSEALSLYESPSCYLIDNGEQYDDHGVFMVQTTASKEAVLALMAWGDEEGGPTLDGVYKCVSDLDLPKLKLDWPHDWIDRREAYREKVLARLPAVIEEPEVRAALLEWVETSSWRTEPDQERRIYELLGLQDGGRV
jgi:hypothetical protein